MSRRPLKFRQADLTRALKAAERAGIKMAVEISADFIRLTPVALTTAATPKEVNPWDK